MRSAVRGHGLGAGLNAWWLRVRSAGTVPLRSRLGSGECSGGGRPSQARQASYLVVLRRMGFISAGRCWVAGVECQEGRCVPLEQAPDREGIEPPGAASLMKPTTRSVGVQLVADRSLTLPAQLRRVENAISG